MQPSISRNFYGFLKGVAPMDPEGVTVHYTADRDPMRTIKSLQQAALAYHYLIDNFGTIFHLVDVHERVNHAGKALWNGRSPNRTHIAVALLSWGRLTKQDDGTIRTWNNIRIPESGTAFRLNAYWDKASEIQELALLALLRKLCYEEGIDATDICGHDECAIPSGRKTDPGGVLSRTMAEIRSDIFPKDEDLEI